MHLESPYVLRVASLGCLGTSELDADREPLSGVSEKSFSLGSLGSTGEELLSREPGKRFSRCGD
jgi:hypothetical protein